MAGGALTTALHATLALDRHIDIASLNATVLERTNAQVRTGMQGRITLSSPKSTATRRIRGPKSLPRAVKTIHASE